MRAPTLLLLLWVANLGTSYAQSKSIVIEEVKLTETIDHKAISKIPRLKDNSNSANPIVKKINDYILDVFSLESYDQSKISEFNWNEVTFTSNIKEGVAYISYTGEYYGAYPTYVQEELFFDLTSGELINNIDIAFQSLFTLQGYFEFMNKFWLPGVKPKFSEAIECSESEEPFCSFYDIDSYNLIGNKLEVNLTNDCFPRVIQACSPSFSKTIPIDSVKSFLSDVGKRVLMTDHYTDKKGIDKLLYNQKNRNEIPNNLFLFSAIDGKYPISMALNLSNDGTVSGFYYYDKKRQKLTLSGTHSSSSIKVNESVNGKITGSFNVSWSKDYDTHGFHLYLVDESIYFKGTWSNPDKTKTFTIQVKEIKVTNPIAWKK